MGLDQDSVMIIHMGVGQPMRLTGPLTFELGGV